MSVFQSKLLSLSVGYLDMGPFYCTMLGVIPEDYNLNQQCCEYFKCGCFIFFVSVYTLLLYRLVKIVVIFK